MTSEKPRPKNQRYSQELTIQEQVHVALGSASSFDDFYVILGCILVDPNIFDFSRALVLRYDDVQRSFVGRLAIGAGSEVEHEHLRKEIMAEAKRLEQQIETLSTSPNEAHNVQSLFNLRFHTLWIHYLQERETAGGLNDLFRRVVLPEQELGDEHIVRRVLGQPRAQLVKSARREDLAGLEEFLRPPFLGGKLVTKRGLHALVFVDRRFQSQRLDSRALYQFQWLLNHASVTLDNVELLEELRETTARLQEVDRIKSNFLSIVSHELRTPLTSIVGFVQILQQEKAGSLTPFQRDLLRRVAYHAANLQNMVNDIIEIAQVEAGGMIHVELGPVDPLSALLETIPKVEWRRGSKNVVIQPVVTEEVPLVRAHRESLQRIFYHLLDNAVKFIPEEGHVRIYFQRRDNWLDIAIEDTGIGISPENLRKIFDYFYQEDFRLERSFGGMGIGLTIVKLLLEATGGQIRAESKPGVGSRFTVSYPLAATPAVQDVWFPSPGL